MRYHLNSTLPIHAFKPRFAGPFGHGMTLEGGGGDFSPVQVIGAVVAVAATVLGAPYVGEAIFEYLGTTAVEAGVSAEVVGASAIGAGSSAINTAVAGGNIEDVAKAAAIGGAAGFVGAEVGEAVGGFTEAPGQFGPTAAELGYTPPPTQVIEPTGVAGATESVPAGNIAKGGAGGFSREFTRAELGGQNLQQALRRGEIGGVTGAATAGISELLQAGDVPAKQAGILTALGGPYLSREVTSYFPGSTPTSQAGGRTSTTTRQTTAGGLPTSGSRSLGGAGGGGYYPAVGSAALGQALGVGGASSGLGSTGGYGAGGETLSPETGGKQQTVWNIESLRVKPEES